MFWRHYKPNPTTSHVMVDLETLGKGPGCRILSIGAVVFSPSGLGNEFYREVQVNNQDPLVSDLDTIAWWEKQSAEARERLYTNQHKKPMLKYALTDFNLWLICQGDRDDKHNLKVCLWGNGADFDNAIMQYAYKALDAGVPAWPFWNNRCYRTLKNLRPDVKLERQGTHHNALDDAKSQALHAIQLLNSLKAW